MKKIYLLFYSAFLIIYSAFGQGGTWTWISGDSAANSSGVFGTQGVPSVNNHPPGLYEAAEWKDKEGNFWVYGGSNNIYSDLWKYDPVANEWTWVKGNGMMNQPPVYGTQGVSDSLNTPGERVYAAVTWVDTSGSFWLFGGDQNSNDLWKYDIGSNQWTWMKGDSIVDAAGVHGIQGVPSASNTPGARFETCSAWTDSLNNLWLFGGAGYDDNGSYGGLNDLCKYDISTNEWTWMKGSAIKGASPVYGTKGVANTTNDPGARWTYTKWKDLQGNFWLMGGSANSSDEANDVWKYDLITNEWIWMNGSNVGENPGVYGITCSPNSTYLPNSRYEQRSAVTDDCGKFWLFGGRNFLSNAVFNDLWVFDPLNLKWNWLSGSNVPNQHGNYGSLGISSASNLPSSRCGAVAWWGNDNKFYMFGGGLGSYADVWVFNPDTNCVPVCGAVAVLSPIANFQSNVTTVCANDCINFTDKSTNATSWQWSFAGALDSTSTAQNPQNVCYSKAGIYNVTLIASNAGRSDSVTSTNYITVIASPPTPGIIQHHDTLYCSTDPSYTSYQWSFDSTLITGATDTFLVVSKSGNYNVQVANENGCKIAVGINIVLGLQNYANDNVIYIFPNPATDELLISGGWQSAAGKKLITIFDMLGETIYVKELNAAREGEIINCKPFPAGIYFVQVASESDRWVGRFVKE